MSTITIEVDPLGFASLYFTVGNVEYIVGVQHGEIAVSRATDESVEQLFSYEISELTDEEE